jgi:hypothetical protein
MLRMRLRRLAYRRLLNLIPFSNNNSSSHSSSSNNNNNTNTNNSLSLSLSQAVRLAKSLVPLLHHSSAPLQQVTMSAHSTAVATALATATATLS